MAESNSYPQDYKYEDTNFSHSHGYLLPVIEKILEVKHPERVFEVGCGNGSFAHWLRSRGILVKGVDPSVSGIAMARKAYPDIELAVGSAYDDLAGAYGRFPVVVGLEVIEHVYYPRKFAQTVFDLLEPGGLAILSTPYHGYWKNVALAVSGQLDAHFTALWDGGHIKFWSKATLGTLLIEAGFENVSFSRVGRIPPFAKSMIATATKPCG